MRSKIDLRFTLRSTWKSVPPRITCYNLGIKSQLSTQERILRLREERESVTIRKGIILWYPILNFTSVSVSCHLWSSRISLVHRLRYNRVRLVCLTSAFTCVTHRLSTVSCQRACEFYFVILKFRNAEQIICLFCIYCVHFTLFNNHCIVQCWLKGC